MPTSGTHSFGEGLPGSRRLHFVSDIDRQDGVVGAVVEGVAAFTIDLGDDVCAECFPRGWWIRTVTMALMLFLRSAGEWDQNRHD
jgi:hypothetical protein